MLLDEEHGELYVRASKNLTQSPIHAQKVTDSSNGKVYNKRAIAIGNDSQWKRTHSPTRQILIYVPWFYKNKPIGVLWRHQSFEGNFI
ncbi:MAG: hypothetical protein H6667_24340 [Ardenticatenaceae bacterium]|nr:hypothetical protein [Ardenticatenaceae bacterium]